MSGVLVDFVQIARALDTQTLVPNRDVDAWLDELEVAARVELEPGTEPASRSRAETRLRMIYEYLALRSLARRHGWSASDDQSPARPETIGLRSYSEHTASAAAELPDATTALIERTRTATQEPAAEGFETAVMAEREPRVPQ